MEGPRPAGYAHWLGQGHGAVDTRRSGRLGLTPTLPERPSALPLPILGCLVVFKLRIRVSERPWQQAGSSHRPMGLEGWWIAEVAV